MLRGRGRFLIYGMTNRCAVSVLVGTKPPTTKRNGQTKGGKINRIENSSIKHIV